MRWIALIVLWAVVLGASFVLYKYDTLRPCGILRLQVAEEAMHRGRVPYVIATSMPDDEIDAMVAARYGQVTPARCLALIFSRSSRSEPAIDGPAR